MAEPTAPTAPVLTVGPDALAATVADLVAAGARYRMLVASDERGLGGTGLALEVVLGIDGASQRIRAELPLDDPTYPSLTPLVPAAHWDEREAADLLGVIPEGHPDPRRLVLHETYPLGYHPLRKDVPGDVPPARAVGRFKAFTAEGEGIYQLPVGPIHAGVIEPGHFRFSAVGERVLHLDARLFYTHRGLEKAAEGRALADALPLLERACGVCTVTHALASSQAVEALTGTPVPPRAAWGRVLLAELERLYNHVGDLGNICAGMGFHPGTSRLGALKERLLGLNDRLVGHRSLMGMVVPGGLRRDLAADGLATLPDALADAGHELAAAVRMVVRSAGVLERLGRTGTVTADLVRALGGSGVTAKAVGLDADLRRDAPYAAYGELEVPVVTHATGDVAARFHVRADEAQDTLRLLREVLERLPAGDARWPVRSEPTPGAVAIAGAEGPRGTSWIWLRAGRDGVVDRVRLRSASYAGWAIVAAAVPGDLVPDFPLINKSFELCYACTDR